MRRCVGFVLAAMFAGGAARAEGSVRPEGRRFSLVARGALVQASVGMSRVGYDLFGDVGGESVGISTFGDHYLLVWELMATARGGVLANTEPYLPLFGVAAAAAVEPVYRMQPGALSPAVTLRLRDEAQALWNGQASLARGRLLNEMDGVGGVGGRAVAGLGAGSSWLDMRRSILAEAFVQEWFRTRGVFSPARSFTEVGLAGRLDMLSGLATFLELRVGFAPAHDDALLDRTTETTRLGARGSVRKIFANRMWLAAFFDVTRETASTTFHRPAETTFDTAPPADFASGVTFGVPIGGSK